MQKHVELEWRTVGMIRDSSKNVHWVLPGNTISVLSSFSVLTSLEHDALQGGGVEPHDVDKRKRLVRGGKENGHKDLNSGWQAHKKLKKKRCY